MPNDVHVTTSAIAAFEAWRARELSTAEAEALNAPRQTSILYSIASSARTGTRHSPNETLWNIARDRLHWLDVGRHNYLAPFLGFVGDEFAEISGRACKHRAAQIGKPCFEFWICNADIDFLVQPFDELYGRALRSTNAVPCTYLVVRHRVD